MHLLKLWLLAALLCLTACRTTAEPSPTPTAVPPTVTIPPTAGATSAPTETAVPTETIVAAETAVASPTAAVTPLPSPTPSPTPDPYAAYTIDALTARTYGDGELEIIDRLEDTDAFSRYLITYPSDGLTIYGYMNVPHEGDTFPVAILLHGYIDPAEYETVAYTQRYADALAEAGYFVIHPNFRNYPPSDSGPDPFRTGYAVDILNLIAIIREQSRDPTGYLRRADADNIHLWGHSMGGGVALRVLTVNNADYLKTAVLYGAMSGDEHQNYDRILRWSGGRRGRFELNAPSAMLDAISPINYLDRLNAAISIHHSLADDVVPAAWSEDLCRQLQARDHPVECYTYIGLPHTFYGQGDELFIERFIDFFDRH